MTRAAGDRFNLSAVEFFRGGWSRRDGPRLFADSAGQRPTVSAPPHQQPTRQTVGVLGVQFQVDGYDLPGESRARRTRRWNCSGATDGQHTLSGDRTRCRGQPHDVVVGRHGEQHAGPSTVGQWSAPFDVGMSR